MTFVLDSSALVAHALNLTGANEVQALLDDDEHEILLSALSLFELAGVLKQQGAKAKIPVYWETYRECATVVPADAVIIEAAWRLRERVGQRIPMADAVIAATAQTRSGTLVHRDQHLAQIPQRLLPQVRLPGG
jgi:predicted nucleic acid-binding protein